MERDGSPGAHDRFTPVTLTGRHVALVPLAAGHHDGLVEAVRDGALWRLWYAAVPSPDGMAAEIERRLGLQAAGTMLPFTVLDGATGRVTGMTTFMRADLASPRIEIGSTWYADAAQRTALNTEAKLLLLTHAFELIGFGAVELRTHVMNRASRGAIERLGAKFEGILRAQRRAPDGTIGDSAVYSIIASEWPSVRSHLRWQLDKPR